MAAFQREVEQLPRADPPHLLNPPDAANFLPAARHSVAVVISVFPSSWQVLGTKLPVSSTLAIEYLSPELSAAGAAFGTGATAGIIFGAGGGKGTGGGDCGGGSRLSHGADFCGDGSSTKGPSNALHQFDTGAISTLGSFSRFIGGGRGRGAGAGKGGASSGAAGGDGGIAGGGAGVGLQNICLYEPSKAAHLVFGLSLV